MSNKAWLNLLLALLLLGLLAVVIYEPGKPKPPGQEKLTALMPERVRSLRIENTGRPPVVLQKQQGHWRMEAPFKLAANVPRIEALLKVLQAASIAHYPASQVDAKQLQLDDPVLVLRVDGEVLRFGGTAALGGSRYLQVGDVIHLITDRYTHWAKGPATDLISPLLLAPQAAGEIVALELPGMQLVQQEDGDWLANGARLAGDVRQSMLEAWRHARALRVSALVDNPAGRQVTQKIRIRLKHNGKLRFIDFTLLRGASEYLFQRRDLGIQYHFPADVAEPLLALPAGEGAR